MAKYKVELGGFVSVFRHRNLTVHADSESEAIDKATDIWYDIQQRVPGNMCGEPTIDRVTKEE